MSKRTQSDLKTKSKCESVISAGAQLTLFWSAGRYLKAKTPLPMTINIPPAEAEERYYAILEKPAMAA